MFSTGFATVSRRARPLVRSERYFQNPVAARQHHGLAELRTAPSVEKCAGFLRLRNVQRGCKQGQARHDAHGERTCPRQ